MYEDLKPDTNTLEPNGDDWRKACNRRRQMLEDSAKEVRVRISEATEKLKRIEECIYALDAVKNLAEAKAERRVNGVDKAEEKDG